MSKACKPGPCPLASSTDCQRVCVRMCARVYARAYVCTCTRTKSTHHGMCSTRSCWKSHKELVLAMATPVGAPRSPESDTGEQHTFAGHREGSVGSSTGRESTLGGWPCGDGGRCMSATAASGDVTGEAPSLAWDFTDVGQVAKSGLYGEQ